MKHFIFSVVSTALCAVIISCTDSEEVEIQSTLSVETSLESAVLGFQEYQGEDFKVDDTFRIRVTNYVYDNSGKLVEKKDTLAKQFTETVKMEFVLPDGDYKILATTDVVVGTTLSNIETEFYTASGTDNLNTFQFDENDLIKSLYTGILTATLSDVSLKEGKKEIRINVKPLTALIRCIINNIHYTHYNKEKECVMTYLEIQYDKRFDRANYETNQWKFISTSSETDGFRLSYVDLTDSFWDDYPGSYDLISVFPGTYKFSGYGEYIWAGDWEKYYTLTDYSSSLTIESGKQYNVLFDVEDFSISFEKASNSSRIISPFKNCVMKMRSFDRPVLKLKDVI